jgi:hypothetical protein
MRLREKVVKKVVNGEDDHENAVFRRMNLPPD